MQTKLLLLALSLSISLVLNGCTTLTPITSHQLHYLSWQKRSAELNKITRWSISGVFSITHHNQTDIAYFDWAQDHNNFSLEIYGPFHLSNIKIIGKPGEVFLFKTSETIIRATSPETLIRQETNWVLPISNLAFWIRNLPAPPVQGYKEASAIFDEYHHIATLKQQGWQIKYDNFVAISAIDLPSKLEVSTIPSATLFSPQEQLKIKMVIKSWKLPT